MNRFKTVTRLNFDAVLYDNSFECRLSTCSMPRPAPDGEDGMITEPGPGQVLLENFSEYLLICLSFGLFCRPVSGSARPRNGSWSL